MRRISQKKQNIEEKQSERLSLNKDQKNSLEASDEKTTGRLDCSNTGDCSRNFRKTMKSFTARLVSKKKENKNKNIHRCSTWPSYSMNNFNPSMAKQ